MKPNGKNKKSKKKPSAHKMKSTESVHMDSSV